MKRSKMEKTHSKLKNYQAFFEDITQHSYSSDKGEKKDSKEKTTPAKVKEEEEQSKSSINSILEKCIENVEEIVNMFDKDDQKLISLVLPILDLCQTNLNFLEKKSEGQKDLMETSKTIIKKLVETLKKEYPNNDPVTELIQNCGKL